MKNLKFWEQKKPEQHKAQKKVKPIIDCVTAYNEILRDCDKIIPSLDGFFVKNHTKMSELDWKKVDNFVSSKKANKDKSQERSMA